MSIKEREFIIVVAIQKANEYGIMSFCHRRHALPVTLCHLADVINCAKFYLNMVRGFDSVGVEFLAFLWERDVALNTGLELFQSLNRLNGSSACSDFEIGCQANEMLVSSEALAVTCLLFVHTAGRFVDNLYHGRLQAKV